MFWLVIVLLSMLSTLLLVVCVAMLKYIQLSRIYHATERAWYNDGTCTGRKDESTCKLAVMDSLPPPPMTTLPQEFSIPLALRVADYVTRIQLVAEDNHTIATPPDHIEVARFTPQIGPPFGAGWTYESTLIICFRATFTHHELQDDLMAWQVDFDTGERIRKPLHVNNRDETDIFGTETLVHSGFHAVFARYVQEVLDLVLKHQPRILLLGGHSLGGAVSTLLALSIAERRTQFTQLEYFAVYVYGTPRVGNPKLDERLRQQRHHVTFWRVVNEADMIQYLPLDVTPNFKHPSEEPFYYKHAGPMYAFYENQGSWRNNHRMQLYSEHLKKMST